MRSGPGRAEAPRISPTAFDQAGILWEVELSHVGGPVEWRTKTDDLGQADDDLLLATLDDEDTEDQMDDYPIGFDRDGNLLPVHSPANPLYARGAVLGLAVGDALGTTLEFTRPEASPFPELMRGPHRDITGGGPFHLAAGQVTDDTQMAACLATSLMTRGGLDVNDLAARYMTWRQLAFDVGGQISTALGKIQSGTPAAEAGRQVWLERNRQPAGNGSLMRTLPIGLFYAGQDDHLLSVSLTESAITHFDPRCQLACAGFNATISAATYAMKDRREAAAAAVHAIDRAAELLAGQYPDEAELIVSARKNLRADMRAAMEDDPRLYTDELHLHRHAGFVRVAFRLAFWHFLHTRSFEDALVDVVNRGGDADTNGAITGALLGAAVGEDAIPEAWRHAVIEALADTPDNPLASEYHPRAVLALVHERE